MKLSKLKDLFENKMSLEDFKKEIEREIITYKNQSKEIGRSVSIYIIEDIENFVIKKEHILFLCDAYLNEILDRWQLNYISEAIAFCDYIIFDSEKTSLAIEFLTDPEFNRLISDEFILKVVSELQAI